MSERCPVCNGPVTPQDSSCPSCGFKLLGTTQEFEPIDMNEHDAVSRHAKAVQSASLTVVRGPQIGTCYQLDDKELTVGRSPQCDIFLNDMTVSRAHAIIKPENGAFVIRDQQSYNGIWINNDSVDEAILRQDDIVQIGAFCLLYQK